MPNDNDDSKPGDGGTPPGDGQPDNPPANPPKPDNDGGSDGGDGGGDEGGEQKTEREKELEEQLEKANTLADQRKKDIIAMKAKQKKLGGGDESGSDDGAGDDGGEGEGDAGEGDDVDARIDAKFAERDESTRKTRDDKAKAIFLDKHPELLEDEALLNEIIADVSSPKEGDSSDVVKALEKSRVGVLYSHGKLDEVVEGEKQRAARKAKIDAEVEAGRAAGDTGDGRSAGGGASTSLSPEGEQIARGMHVDPSKASKVKYADPDTGEAGDNIIDPAAPKPDK